MQHLLSIHTDIMQKSIAYFLSLHELFLFCLIIYLLCCDKITGVTDSVTCSFFSFFFLLYGRVALRISSDSILFYSFLFYPFASLSHCFYSVVSCCFCACQSSKVNQPSFPSQPCLTQTHQRESDSACLSAGLATVTS